MLRAIRAELRAWQTRAPQSGDTADRLVGRIIRLADYDDAQAEAEWSQACAEERHEDCTHCTLCACHDDDET